MGTGSVALWLLRLFRVCRRCLSPFSDGQPVHDTVGWCCSRSPCSLRDPHIHLKNPTGGVRITGPMNILFLHGWQSTLGGRKPAFLKDHGHEVLNPHLPDDDFDAAVRIAQAEFDRHHPDVVVGSSRGGAVAINIDSGDTPLVLLCPAWKTWGTATTVKPKTTILHSEADETVPIADSRELLKNSGLPESALIVVGTEHRLADEESLKAMERACERASVNGGDL